MLRSTSNENLLNSVKEWYTYIIIIIITTTTIIINNNNNNIIIIIIIIIMKYRYNGKKSVNQQQGNIYLLLKILNYNCELYIIYIRS